MSLIHRAKEVISWVGIVLGFMSAYYWYKASVAKVTDDKSGHHPGVELRYEDPNNKGQSIYVVASAMEQSRLNKIAATYTALAVLFQAVASALPPE
jgi:hypothetical protein